MRLILFILLLSSLNGNSQALFKPGYYNKGIHVTDLYGVVWQVNRAGTYQSINSYFTFVRYGFSPIENLFARVEAIEAKPAGATTDLTALTARIKALEALAASPVNYTRQIDSLNARVKALEDRPAGTTTTSTAGITALTKRVTELEKPYIFSGQDFVKSGDTISVKPIIFSALDFYVGSDGKIRVKK